MTFLPTSFTLPLTIKLHVKHYLNITEEETESWNCSELKAEPKIKTCALCTYPCKIIK